MSAALEIQDAIIDHAVNVERYSRSVIRAISQELNAVEKDIIGRIAASKSPDRLKEALSEIEDLNRRVYLAHLSGLKIDLREFADVSVNFETTTLNKAINKVTVVPTAQIYVPSAATVHSLAIERPFDGRTLAEWFGSLVESKQQRLTSAVRTGIVSNESVSQITRRVRDLLPTNRRQAETIIRSAVHHTAGVARIETYRANRHLVETIMWSATLDARTTPTCRSRDGLNYDLETLRPIGHNLPWRGGPGSAHVGCRSTAIPDLMRADEIKLDLEPDKRQPGSRPFVALEAVTGPNGEPINFPRPAHKMSVGEYGRVLRKAGYSQQQVNEIRSRFIGQVEGGLTFPAWLLRQSEKKQALIIGPARAQALRKAGLSDPIRARDIVGEMTLAELKEKYPSVMR